MKAKRLLSILALTLAATTLTACGDKTVTFGHYWRTNSLVTTEPFYEQAEYAVSSTSAASSYANYTVEYTGTFTTTLEYIANEGIYQFDTKLNVTATFKLGEEEKAVTDTAESSVTFDATTNALRPIKSYKKMLCHIPRIGEFNSAETCYSIVDYEYDITYPKDKDQGTITTKKYQLTNSSGESIDYTLNGSFDFEEDYSYIDNEQLLVAVRALSAETTSATLGSYGVFTKTAQKVKISYTNAEDDANKTYAYTLTNADGSDGGTTHNVLARTAELVLDQKNPGNTQEILLAKAKDPSKNVHRNVILSIKTPLSYAMGIIEYKLTKVSYFKA